MSDDQQISRPANSPDECFAEQPPEDYVSCPVSPPSDDIEMTSRDDDDASPAPSQNDDAIDDVIVPLPNIDADAKSPPKEDDSPASPPQEDAGPASSPQEVAGPASPPKEDATPSPSQINDTAHRASRSSLPLNKNIKSEPKVKLGSSKANSRNRKKAKISYEESIRIKQEIKHETIDLGNDTYYYEENKEIPVKSEPKVGFDRGLEPDHIVGATEEDGKLKFLIAWKNSNAADLLESTVVYNRCPQLAIQFFEARLKYCPNEETD